MGGPIFTINKSKAERLLKLVFGNNPFHNGEELLFFCPNCNHHKRKLSFNIKLNVGKCWVCDQHGTVTSYLRKYGSREVVEEWKKIRGISTENSEDKNNEVLLLPQEFKSLRKENLSPYRRVAIDYLIKRQIDSYMINRYNIGYCEEGKYANRIVFPSYDLDGHLNFFTSRSVYDTISLKYLTPKVNKSNIIFNELFLDFSEPIILTEGVFDSIRIENAVPLLGSSLSKESKLFKQLAKHRPRVYIALDRDAKQKALKIIKDLSSWNVETLYVDLKNWDDLGEVPTKQLSEVFSNCLTGSFKNQISLELN